MYWLLESVYYLVVHTLCDLIFYVLVDVVVKLSLKDASEDSEKRTIWLWESFLLILVSLGVYMFHHTPYVLFTLGFSTLIYTQLLGRINFRYWWWQLVTSWDEFEQHEESMEAYHHRQSVASMPPPLSPVSPPVSRPAYIPQPNMGMGVVPSPLSYEMGPRPEGMVPQPVPQYEAWYPSDADRAAAMRPPAPYPHIPMSEPQMMPSQVPPTQMRFRPQMGPPSPQFYPQQMAQMQRFATPVMPRAELARKPIHSYLSTPPKKPQADLGFSSRLKSSVMSAFGMTLNHSNLPLGIKNNGQNLCFMNSVLQCLAHSPTLVDCIVHDSQHARCNSSQRAALDIVTEMISALTAPPGNSDTVAVDSHKLRAVLSSVPGTVLVDPYSKTAQPQQDAAEFFMWLLDTLHSALNTQKNDENIINHFAQGRQQPANRLPVMRYASMTLNMLKFIYGDLTSQRIAELKTACRNEIEQANGLESESYAEPIQRLSDLEWLTYKEANSSVIDDMFTGQLVESQHCVACNRISVGIQTFNILPVPVVEPRQNNGLVCLEDCFKKFSNVEDLFGPDGLHCECCNKAVVAGDGVGTPGRRLGTPGRGRVAMQEAVSLAASPILVNGGNGAKRGHTDLRRRRGNVASSDSAICSASSPLRGDPGATPMSPIPLALGGDVFSDSGYHDNQFRTSTPIGAPLPVRLTDGQRRSLLRQLPECLIVQLMRFSVLNGKPRKVQRAVSIPVSKLDLTPLIIDNVMRREDLTAINACFQYNLYGLCLHLGSETTGQGHYISYTLASNGRWYKFDDDKVTQVNINYELNTRQVTENAYLLFYHRSEDNQRV